MAGKRWIEFVPNTELKNPDTGETLLDKDTGKPVVITMEIFMKKLMANPLWNDGWNQAQAQDEIMKDFGMSQRAGATGMWVAEEHFPFLEQAAKNPRFVIVGAMGSTSQTGFGFHPAMSRQFVPFQASIVNAKTEADKKKFEDELEKLKSSLAAKE